MSHYLIDIESFILVEYDDRPTQQQVEDSIRGGIEGLMDNMRMKVVRY